MTFGTRSQAQEVGLAGENCLLPCYAKRRVFLMKTLLEGRNTFEEWKKWEGERKKIHAKRKVVRRY
jgi:hypothetical protein